MKGWGTLDHDALKKASPSAKSAKPHYLIVDPIGVTKSVKTTHPTPPVTRSRFFLHEKFSSSPTQSSPI